jgi:hypothetical protein
VNNNAAGLPPSLPYQPFGWNAITMYVDPKTHTTATLYGNAVAVKAVQTRPHAGGLVAPTYAAGAVLALVTWGQREDPHWFGARIPDTPRSVEFVQLAVAGEASRYWSFAGADLIEDHRPGDVGSQRTDFILGLAPAQLP